MKRWETSGVKSKFLHFHYVSHMDIIGSDLPSEIVKNQNSIGSFFNMMKELFISKAFDTKAHM